MEKPLKLRKPEITLASLLGLLLATLIIGGIILSAIYSLANGGAFIIYIVVFLLLLLPLLKALVNARYIYISEDTLSIKYRLGLQKNIIFPLSTATAFFPFKFTRFDNVAPSLQVWVFGITILCPDATTLTLKSDSATIDFLVALFKKHDVKNLNTAVDYDINSGTNYISRNFFRTNPIEKVALEQVLEKIHSSQTRSDYLQQNNL